VFNSKVKKFLIRCTNLRFCKKRIYVKGVRRKKEGTEKFVRGENTCTRAGGTERRRWCLATEATEPDRLEKDWRIEALTGMNSNALSLPKELSRISYGSDPHMP